MTIVYAPQRQATAPLGCADLHWLMSLMTGPEKHSAAATSTMDGLWGLYDRILRIDLRHPADPLRDVRPAVAGCSVLTSLLSKLFNPFAREVSDDCTP